MIKVSVLYPSRNNMRFDMNYYCNRHIPMVQQLLGSALKGVFVDQGVAGGEPGHPRPTSLCAISCSIQSKPSKQASARTHRQSRTTFRTTPTPNPSCKSAK